MVKLRGLLEQRTVNSVLTGLAPMIERMLTDPVRIWGPRFVAVVVLIQGEVCSWEYFGSQDQWDPAWADPVEFYEVAYAKAKLALRTGLSTREVRERAPFLLQRGDYLWAGGVAAPGIAVGVSGATENGDEEIATEILNTYLSFAAARVSERMSSTEDSDKKV